jgi:hypothetical protein
MSAPTLPSITAAAFGTLTARGLVPLTGVTGKFATYSVLNNGSVVASGLTASTYTITSLGDNVQIGPVTVVPYNGQGVAGSAFTVTGGSGSGKIYTWAYISTFTFSGTSTGGTTLVCTGAFSKVYVIYSGGPSTTASGTLITGTDSISQIYSGMIEGTYTFTVYPVNGNGISAFDTGSISITNTVDILPSTVWVSAGSGTNSIAYSTDGYNWTGRGQSVFSTYGKGVAYSKFQNIWVVVGYGTQNVAYSSDGYNWTGKNTPLAVAYGVAYSENAKYWISLGDGSAGLHSIAYSKDGLTWTGRGKTVFATYGFNAVYNENTFFWVGVGQGTDTLAYSKDGLTWTGITGTSIFSTYGYGIAYNNNLWVATGYGNVNTLAYSTNGINWTGRGKVFTTAGSGVVYSTKQSIWVANGAGTNMLAYSKDGYNWTGITGTSTFSNIGRNLSYSAYQDIWTACGDTANMLAYSKNGYNWTGITGTSIFSTTADGIACYK